ncbi:hypothetical protein QOT17_000514 [Balamuthia mandrillaris]
MAMQHQLNQGLVELDRYPILNMSPEVDAPFPTAVEENQPAYMQPQTIVEEFQREVTSMLQQSYAVFRELNEEEHALRHYAMEDMNHQRKLAKRQRKEIEKAQNFIHLFMKNLTASVPISE